MKFNMTPLIDVGFLLIIFFVLVCRYIEAENFPVAVPDECQFAQSSAASASSVITVSITKTAAQDTVRYAVGSNVIGSQDVTEIAGRIAEAIDCRLKSQPASSLPVVCLRADRDTTFEQTQYALAGIAKSGAANIQLAVFKHRQTAED